MPPVEDVFHYRHGFESLFFLQKRRHIAEVAGAVHRGQAVDEFAAIGLFHDARIEDHRHADVVFGSDKPAKTLLERDDRFGNEVSEEPGVGIRLDNRVHNRISR